MHNSIRELLTAGALVACVLGVSTPRAEGLESQVPTRHVDLAIALDVSGSMEPLIASAKQRLWDVVNEIARAQPQPVLRVAIVSYGDPRYGRQSGYVRVDQPFTRDLDSVNETLFAYTTNGGEEYVARAVHTALGELDWSRSQDALRMLFVAGNESAEQDPWLDLGQVGEAATAAGVRVSAVYCGAETDPIAAGWRRVAALTQGTFASIDAQAGAVAVIPTPQDAELAELNRALNATYLAFGADGAGYAANQIAQDENAAEMSPAAAASRVVTKASGAYDASHWDLVDAEAAGISLEKLEEEALPSVLHGLSLTERRAVLADLRGKRAALQTRIQTLDRARRAYLEESRRLASETGPVGLDRALKKGIRALAEAEGFRFDEE